MWRIEKETLEFVSDWVKVAAFQKQKPFVTHNKVLNPDTGKIAVQWDRRHLATTLKCPCYTSCVWFYSWYKDYKETTQESIRS